MNCQTSWEPCSLLFVPADAKRFIAKAGLRGADIVVLDLEDGVAPLSKSAARAELAATTAQLHNVGAAVYVRVNNVLDLLGEDVRAAVSSGADGIVMPKVEQPQQLSQLDDLISHAELVAGRLAGSVRVIALIETPLGVCRAFDIAQSSSRLTALCFGSEDFATAMGVDPSPEALAWPAHAVAVAAVAAGLQPLGIAGSVANFSDIDAYRELIVQSKRLGMRGATCIHPAQVEVLNQVFGGTDGEVAAAERLIAAFEAGLREGKGAIALDGQMIDEPVANRAKTFLSRRKSRTQKLTSPRTGSGLK